MSPGRSGSRQPRLASGARSSRGLALLSWKPSRAGRSVFALNFMREGGPCLSGWPDPANCTRRPVSSFLISSHPCFDINEASVRKEGRYAMRPTPYRGICPIQRGPFFDRPSDITATSRVAFRHRIAGTVTGFTKSEVSEGLTVSVVAQPERETLVSDCTRYSLNGRGSKNDCFVQVSHGECITPSPVRARIHAAPYQRREQGCVKSNELRFQHR